jgi:hypothetical protein
MENIHISADTTIAHTCTGAFKRRGTRLAAALAVERKIIKAVKDKYVGHCTKPFFSSGTSGYADLVVARHQHLVASVDISRRQKFSVVLR